MKVSAGPGEVEHRGAVGVELRDAGASVTRRSGEVAAELATLRTPQSELIRLPDVEDVEAELEVVPR